MPEPNNLAMLVGNGLSIAFNAGLNLQTITEEVMRRIENADGGDVIAAMKELAERALPEGVTSGSDFEQLVGAFGAESRAMSSLETLATLTSPADTDLLDAIRRVASFAEDVRDNGISHVLQVIAERSTAYVDDASDLHQLVLAMKRDFDDRIVIGNLNYDTLLLAALLYVAQHELADMGHGWKKVTVLVNDEEQQQVPALRQRASDFPSEARIRLLHLHGSLTFWGSRESEIYAKLPKGMLEDGTQWQAVRDKTTNVRPVVVLANRRDKAEHVNDFPFNLAYEMFGDGLEQADHWLVIGYSFKDDPVNAALSRKFLEKNPKPKVLVVTHGDLPTQVEVERAFGWGAEDGSSAGWLSINREGANGVQDTADWATFAL